MHSDGPTPDAKYGVLLRVLEQLEGRHLGETKDSQETPQGLVDAVSGFYDETYYGTSYDQSGVPYQRGEKIWEDLFATLADAIVDTLSPRLF